MKTLAERFPKALHANKLNLARFNKLLPPAITLLLIIACTYTLSQISWALIPGEVNKTAPTSRNNSANNTKKSAFNNYKHIADAHLFGEYQINPTSTATKDAPETRLNLVLKGVLAATPMKLASAIIAMGKNGKEDIYGIGDKVSSATVKEIYADRVILLRNGLLETLRMPKDSSGNFIKSVSTNSPRPIDRSSPGRALSDIRNNILKNPTSFGKYAIPIPYRENGKLRGYRLRPQGDNTLFDAIGIKPTDVVLAINGVELNSPKEGLKALRSLQKAKQVNLTVLRNGAELPLQFDIP
jgi:general secretion pathway protein C